MFLCLREREKKKTTTERDIQHTQRYHTKDQTLPNHKQAGNTLIIPRKEDYNVQTYKKTFKKHSQKYTNFESHHEIDH